VRVARGLHGARVRGARACLAPSVDDCHLPALRLAALRCGLDRGFVAALGRARLLKVPRVRLRVHHRVLPRHCRTPRRMHLLPLCAARNARRQPARLRVVEILPGARGGSVCEEASGSPRATSKVERVHARRARPRVPQPPE